MTGQTTAVRRAGAAAGGSTPAASPTSTDEISGRGRKATRASYGIHTNRTIVASDQRE